MKSSRRRLKVNVDELDRIIDSALRAPLSAADGQTLKTAVHAMAARLMQRRSTEKTSAVLAKAQASQTTPGAPPDTGKSDPAGHGRNGAAAFTGANRVSIAHDTLESGDACPDCHEGRVYRQKEPATFIHIVGQAPLAATVFERERLRCNACGQMFTAEEPETRGIR